MTTAPPRALLLENVHPDAEAVLSRAGFAVERLERALEEDELVERLPGVRVLGIRSATHVTEKALAAGEDLAAIGAFCIGTNQIDLRAASLAGVPCSTRRSPTPAASSNWPSAEIIAMTRRLTEKSTPRCTPACLGQVGHRPATRCAGARSGIIGYGNIGTQLSVVAEALGLSVVFYDSSDRLAIGNARRCGTMEELLAISDVVTLHVDGRPGNNDLFGEAEFARMKPGSLFLNLSRGFVVDHDALRRHLVSGRIAGAAVDVFPSEPKSRSEEFQSVLRGLPNVILTPHVGGSTEEAQQDIGNFVAGKLRDYVQTGNTSLSVNLPGVALPAADAAVRLVLVHRNVPGVLASINRLFADCSVNVAGQMLSTWGELGYVVTDVAREDAACVRDKVVPHVRALPETVRLEVLG